MHILLINANPVVSRLLALCTRDAAINLEEVEDITFVKRKHYDIVFVDEMVYKDEVLALDNYVNTDKKVLFSNEDIAISAFDMTIKKPFLPSQIIAILEEVEVPQKHENIVEEAIETEEVSIFPLSSESIEAEDEPQVAAQVLDNIELEKIKTLLDMDEEPDTLEALSDDEIEMRKIEVIKEQLIADGLEIVEEDEIVEALSAKDTIKIFEEDTLPQVQTLKTTKMDKKKKKSKKTLAYTEQELEKIEDAIQMAIATLKRKQMKKLLKGKKIDVAVQIKGTY